MKIPVSKEPDKENAETPTEMPEFVKYNKIKYLAVKIRLLVDLPDDLGYSEYVAGFEMVAGVDKDGRVCVPTLEGNGKTDIAYLKDGEYEICDWKSGVAVVESKEPKAEPKPEPEPREESPPADAIEIAEADDFSLKVGNPPEIRWKLNQDGTVNQESYREISGDIHAAELAYLEAGHECKRIADEIARLQAEHEIAIERRKSLGVDLCRVLEKRLRETLDKTECEVNIKGTKEPSQVVEKTTAESPISEKPTGDYSNLSAPISELWANNPIERFGKKKCEALQAACPTIGDFERLREQAGRAFKPLCDLLPDGIGQAVADELEERQLTWFRNNHDQLVPVESSATIDDNDGSETDDGKESEIDNQTATETESGEIESNGDSSENTNEETSQGYESSDGSPYVFS